MKDTLKTEDVYIEVTKREDGTHILNMYGEFEEFTAYLTDREMKALIKMLTRVNLGLKQY